MIFSKQKTFFNQVKSLNKGEIVDSELIWKSFEGANAEGNVSYFCLQLFEQVLHSEKKTYLLHNEERLYATLLFMELYKNKKTKSAKVLQQCGNFLQKMESSHGKSFLQFFFRVKRQQTYGQFFISRLVMAPNQFSQTADIKQQMYKQISETEDYIKTRNKQTSFSKNYQAFKYASYPKAHLPETKLLTFGYICFVDHIKNNKFEVTKSEYKHLSQMMKYLMHAVQAVSISEELLLVLIHLIIKCITFYGCAEQEILKEFMMWADKLRCFPGPIEKIGSIFFHMLYEELKIPGTAFRKKLRKDFASLGIKQNIFINREFYLVTDEDHIYSRHEDLSLSTLRKLIIVNTLKTSNYPQKEINQFIKNLRQYDNQETFVFYDKLTKILQVAMKFDSRARIQQVLKQYISKLITETQSKRDPAKKQLKGIEQEQFDVMAKKMSRLGFFQYPNYEIVTVPILDFCSPKDNVCNLSRIVQKNKTDYQAKGFLKNKIPLIFYGDGLAYFKFVQTIVRYLKVTDIQQAKQFQIYYMPKHENTCRPGIGLYFARKDSWYRKFVYNICFQKILYPHLQITMTNKDLFPFYLYSKNLQLFLRQANESIPIRVYKCKIKMSEVNEQEQIYMTAYVSIGLFCEARIIKMQKQKEKNKQEKQYSKELIEIIDEKIKKIPPMNLSITVETFQSLTGSTIIQQEKLLKVQDLMICNIPCEYFMGKQPNPESPFLQMTLLTQRNGKIFRKEVGHTDYFKENKPFNEVYQGFKDLFICRTIKKIKIQNLNYQSPLRIIIDGNVANQIESITIQPAVSTNNLPIFLQMQTFLPV